MKLPNPNAPCPTMFPNFKLSIDIFHLFISFSFNNCSTDDELIKISLKLISFVISMFKRLVFEDEIDSSKRFKYNSFFLIYLFLNKI